MPQDEPGHHCHVFSTEVQFFKRCDIKKAMFTNHRSPITNALLVVHATADYRNIQRTNVPNVRMLYFALWPYKDLYSITPILFWDIGKLPFSRILFTGCYLWTSIKCESFQIAVDHWQRSLSHPISAQNCTFCMQHWGRWHGQNSRPVDYPRWSW